MDAVNPVKLEEAIHLMRELLPRLSSERIPAHHSVILNQMYLWSLATVRNSMPLNILINLLTCLEVKNTQGFLATAKQAQEVMTPFGFREYLLQYFACIVPDGYDHWFYERLVDLYPDTPDMYSNNT